MSAPVTPRRPPAEDRPSRVPRPRLPALRVLPALPALPMLPVLVGPFLLSMAGCSALVKSPEVRIARVGLTGAGLTGATARVGLRVENPNGFGLTARSVRYRLEFDEGTSDPSDPSDPDAPDASDGRSWTTVATGQSTEELRVAARDSALVTVDIPFRYQDVGRAVESLLRDGTLRYRLSGDVTVDAPLRDLTVPFDDTGRVGL